MFHMRDIGWGWWLLMSIGVVAFWALAIYVVVWLARGQTTRRSSEAPGHQAPRVQPEEVLKRRLAEGEISVEEYEQLRAVLEHKPREPAAV